MGESRQLTDEAKEQLMRETIQTGTATSQAGGSVLQKMLGADSVSAPKRYTEKETFSRTNLSDFYDYSQTIGSSQLPDGVFIAFVKELITYKIIHGSLTDKSAVEAEMLRVFAEFQESVIRRVKEGERAVDVVNDSELRLTAEVERLKALNQADNDLKKSREAELQEQRKVKLTKQTMEAVMDLKTAIMNIQKTNQSIFTPTGIKAMLAEIKKFDAIPNPTNEQRVELINKIKTIAENRSKEKKISRGKSLHDFYQTISHFDMTKPSTINQTSMSKSQVAISSLVTIQLLTASNNGPDSTFGKIQKVFGEGIPAAEKIAKMKEIVKERLKNGDNLKPEYKQIYKALVRYIEQTEKGKVPNLDDPKLLFLNKKLSDIRNAQIVKNLESHGLIESPRAEPVVKQPRSVAATPTTRKK